MPVLELRALIYGKVIDSSNSPLAGLEINAADEHDLFEAYTVTDSAGNYVIAISSGVWVVNPSTSEIEMRQDLNPLPSRLYIAEGQATTRNFAASKSSAQLSGVLKDNTGATVSDISYIAVRDSGRLSQFGTQSDGSFHVGLSAGVWIFGPLIDSAANTNLIFVIPPDITLTEGQTLAGVNFEAVRPTPCERHGKGPKWHAATAHQARGIRLKWEALQQLCLHR
jgi:hypothetical protein